MLITTTDIVKGYEITKYLGIVTAEVVYGTNVLRDFLLLTSRYNYQVNGLVN